MPLSRSPERRKRDAEVVLRHRPVERHALAGHFLQRGAKGGDRLLQPRRAALALARASQSAMPRLFCVIAQSSGTRSRVISSSAARKAATASSSRAVPLSRSPEPRKRGAEVVLRRRPVERHPLARPFLQRGAVGRDRLLQPRRAALALPERPERGAEVVLRHRPVERHPLARTLGQQHTIALDSLSQRTVVAPLIALAIECICLID